MKSLGANLQRYGDHERHGEDRRRDKIAEVQRHRNGVAARFSQCRRQDLDDPEAKRDCRNLAQRRWFGSHVFTRWLVVEWKLTRERLCSSKSAAVRRNHA